MVLLLSVSAVSLSSSPVIGGSRGRAVAVATGLKAPVGFTFLPNGGLVYAERLTGQIRFRNLTTDGDRRVFRITNERGSANGGALGVAIHPNWPNKRDLFVYATRNTSSGLRVFRSYGSILTVSVQESSCHRSPALSQTTMADVSPSARTASSTWVIGARSFSRRERPGPFGQLPRKGSPYQSRLCSNSGGQPVWFESVGFGTRYSIGLAFILSTRRLWQTDNGPECNDEVNRICASQCQHCSPTCWRRRRQAQTRGANLHGRRGYRTVLRQWLVVSG